MTLDEYQIAALRTAAPKDKKDEVYHLLLGLMGEAGEIAEKGKKIVRDQTADWSKLDKVDLSKELGDVLWYVAVLADYFELSLQDIAATNISKLADRQKRDAIKGSGDNR